MVGWATHSFTHSLTHSLTSHPTSVSQLTEVELAKTKEQLDHANGRKDYYLVTNPYPNPNLTLPPTPTLTLALILT